MPCIEPVEYLKLCLVGTVVRSVQIALHFIDVLFPVLVVASSDFPGSSRDNRSVHFLNLIVTLGSLRGDLLFFDYVLS